jgi:hypothetical protein
VLQAASVPATSSDLASPDKTSPPAVTRRLTTWRRRLALACLGVAVGASTTFIERRPNNHHQIVVAVLKTVHDFIF